MWECAAFVIYNSKWGVLGLLVGQKKQTKDVMNILQFFWQYTNHSMYSSDIPLQTHIPWEPFKVESLVKLQHQYQHSNSLKGPYMCF